MFSVFYFPNFEAKILLTSSENRFEIVLTLPFCIADDECLIATLNFRQCPFWSIDTHCLPSAAAD
jgi:hypothetical protein